jgi:hypothetical protein
LLAECAEFDLLLGSAVLGMFGEILAVVVGNFLDDIERSEVGIAAVEDGEVESAEEEAGAAVIVDAASDAVEHLHEGDLDVFGGFEHGGEVEAAIHAAADALDEVGMEVAEELAAEGGRATTVTGGLDMGAAKGGGWHEKTPRMGLRNEHVKS